MWHSWSIMSLTTWKPTMTVYCNVIVVASPNSHHVNTNIIPSNISVLLSLTSYIWYYVGDSVGTMSRSLSLSCSCFAIVTIRLHVGPKLDPASHRATHPSWAVCLMHSKWLFFITIRQNKKIHIFFSWSHHGPNWLSLHALFSFPVETERLHIWNVQLDCKEGESFISLNDMRLLSVRSAASL